MVQFLKNLDVFVRFYLDLLTRHYMFTYRLHSFVHTTYYSSCNSRYMCGSFSPVSITYVTETYSPVKRVTAISFISTSFMLSVSLAKTCCVVRYSNWHMVYFILTLLYILIAILIYKFVPESPVKNPQLKLVGFFKNF